MYYFFLLIKFCIFFKKIIMIYSLFFKKICIRMCNLEGELFIREFILLILYNLLIFFF